MAVRPAHGDDPGMNDDCGCACAQVATRHGAALCLLLLAGCSTEDSFSRHFDGATWGGALAAQTESAKKLLPELGLLEATVVLATQDHNIQEEATENTPITEGSTANGDGTAVGLTLMAVGLGVTDWANGDEGRSVEVLLESFLVVEGTTELLKSAVGRERPSKDSNTSFPSGHSSYAFTMADFFARRIDDLGDEWYCKLGWLAYAPATYVAIDRVEANRHWPSDVAFGAFLGVFMTNVIYDAHFGSPGHAGIYTPRSKAQWSLEPSFDTENARMEMVLRF